MITHALRSPHVPLRERRVSLGGQRWLGCGEFGAADGEPVFWLHGTPGGRLQLPPTAPREAAERRLRIIVVERPGTGWSSAHRYARVRDFAADLAALADALELPCFSVVGLSGGGPYALACAHDLAERVVATCVLNGFGPVSGAEAVPGRTRLLALLAPMLALSAGPLGWALPRALRPLVPHAGKAVRAFATLISEADRKVLTSPAFEAVFVGDILHVMEDGLSAATEDVRLFTRDWGFRLRDIRSPVFFWQGECDGIVPPCHGRHQASLVPEATLTVSADEGHFSGYASATAVFDLLAAQFAGRVATTTAS
jgi:pimeloyl-ACP methyl ester carboxylesterase